MALPVATSVGFVGGYAASAGLVVLAGALVVVTLLWPGGASGPESAAEGD